MEENLNNNQNLNDGEEETKIVVNDYGATKDGTVVVEEPHRTVLLTEDQTVIIEKTPEIDIVPKNRPRKVYAGMWGQTEIATVAVALLAVLTTILLYVFLVIPAQKELDRNRAENEKLEREMMAADSKYGNITKTEDRVKELKTSVQDFEDRFLPNAATGKTALYQRINGLISAYGLVNTTGPDYSPLDVDPRQAIEVSQKESGKSKFQSLFPGDYVTMTVEGQYQNLRRFIREIETSEQFVIISAVELEPAEAKEKRQQAELAKRNQNQQTTQVDQYGRIVIPGQVPGQVPGTVPQPQQPTAVKVDRGKTYGETVSLRLEMAAYFRRPNSSAFQPIAEGQGQ